jgi:hypothetical protein
VRSGRRRRWFQGSRELDRAVTAMELADHGAGFGVERGKQVDGAIAQVVRRAALSLSGSHGQQRLSAIERLNLCFFVDTQHQCPVRGIKVQAHNVADFFDEQRILREFELRKPVFELSDSVRSF